MVRVVNHSASFLAFYKTATAATMAATRPPNEATFCAPLLGVVEADGEVVPVAAEPGLVTDAPPLPLPAPVADGEPDVAEPVEDEDDDLEMTLLVRISNKKLCSKPTEQDRSNRREACFHRQR